MAAAPPIAMRKKTLDLAAQLRAIAEIPRHIGRPPRLHLLGIKFIGGSTWPNFLEREDTVPDAH